MIALLMLLAAAVIVALDQRRTNRRVEQELRRMNERLDAAMCIDRHRDFGGHQRSRTERPDEWRRAA